MAPPTKSSKQATRGAKQIVEENASTLQFYRYMIFGAFVTYLVIMSILFEFTTKTTLLTSLAGMVFTASYQFMSYMARAKYMESGQLLDSGVDLNMEGGIAEHVKDLIILTSGVLVLSLISNYFWFLWLLAPLRALWMLWVNIISPWIFAEPPAPTEKDEKKQRKLERKMARPMYKSH
ncbi:transmembrane protein 208 [Copidosoma floridanum]|uniref:transmembrane protein 208 n=1 Tax=Copidosoma floridanum TaxID=29053 RepID=UPI0006C9B465|nr:transmembrane protein 208 [Copidosoma floridanum]